jgi:acyl-CoA synthetase (NDP forming)
MSIRNLDKIFNPTSVALVGASSRIGAVGTVTLNNMRWSAFQGSRYLVNPRHASLNGHLIDLRQCGSSASDLQSSCPAVRPESHI